MARGPVPFGLNSLATNEVACSPPSQCSARPEEAFRLISRYSQNTNQRVRVISSQLVRGRLAAATFRPDGER